MSSNISGLSVTMEIVRVGSTPFPHAELGWTKSESDYGEAVVRVKKSVGAKSEVTLSASGSTDTEGDTLTYLWEQVSGTPVELLNVTKSRSMFVAPSSPETHELVFKVTIGDGYESRADEVVVNVTAAPFGSFDNPHVIEDPTGVKGLSILNLMRSGRVSRMTNDLWQDTATFFVFEVPVGQSGEWELRVESVPRSVDFKIARHEEGKSWVGGKDSESYTATLSEGDSYKFGVWRQGVDDRNQSSTEGVTAISLTLIEPAPTARAK